MASAVLSDSGKALERIDEICERVDEMEGLTELTAKSGKAQRIDSAYGSESCTPAEFLKDVEGNKENTWPLLLQMFEEQINRDLKKENVNFQISNDRLRQQIEDLTKENEVLKNGKDDNSVLEKLTAENESLKGANGLLKKELQLANSQVDALSGVGKSIAKREEQWSREKDQLFQDLNSLQEKHNHALKTNAACIEIAKLEKQKATKELEDARSSLEELKRTRVEDNKDRTKALVEEQVAYYTKQVESLQPLLEEAQANRDHLATEVVGLENLIRKKDNDLLILQDRNYYAEVKLSKTRKYINHRERECNQELRNLDFQLKSRINKLNWNLHHLVKARDFFLGKAHFLENKCKALERTQQNSGPGMVDPRVLQLQKKLDSQSEFLLGLQKKLEEARKDYALAQKAYMDQRLKMKAQQNEQCLCKGRLEVAEGDENINIVMKNQFSALAADLEAKDKKIEDVAKEITEKEEALRQQKASYESLRKKLADKDKQLTTMKNIYESSK